MVVAGERLIDTPLLPTDMTPQLLEYHCQFVALLSVPLIILSVVLCVPQLLVWLADTEGIVGGLGVALITTFVDAGEVQPAVLVTV